MEKFKRISQLEKLDEYGDVPRDIVGWSTKPMHRLGAIEFHTKQISDIIARRFARFHNDVSIRWIKQHLEAIAWEAAQLKETLESR